MRYCGSTVFFCSETKRKRLLRRLQFFLRHCGTGTAQFPPPVIQSFGVCLRIKLFGYIKAQAFSISDYFFFFFFKLGLIGSALGHMIFHKMSPRTQQITGLEIRYVTVIVKSCKKSQRSSSFVLIDLSL